MLAAAVFAINAQQEPGAPAALRSMLAPAASVAAAVVSHAHTQKPPARLALSGAHRCNRPGFPAGCVHAGLGTAAAVAAAGCGWWAWRLTQCVAHAEMLLRAPDSRTLEMSPPFQA